VSIALLFRDERDEIFVRTYARSAAVSLRKFDLKSVDKP
jgi:hypothetical protein